MAYTIENKYVTTNSFTVSQAERYYGRKRTVDEFIYHWWNTVANRAKSPMDIYNYMIRANKSVNFILGWDDAMGKVRIIAMTPLDRVALTTQNANIFSISVEVDPLITTSDPRAYELYKALGWLHFQMEKHFGKRLRSGIHKQYWQTQCSPIDKARGLREADKWRSGTYDPVTPKPPIEGAVIEYTRFDDAPRLYKFNRDASMHNFNHKRHADMEKILDFKKGDTIAIVGQAVNKTVNSTYYLTDWSFGTDQKHPNQVRFTNGINMVNLDRVIPDNPIAQEPKVVKREEFKPSKPMEVAVNTYLVEIPSADRAIDTKEYAAGEIIENIAERTEWDNGEKFYRTGFSVSKNIARGFREGVLKDIVEKPPVEPTPPTEPEVPDVPDLPPSEDSYAEQNNNLLKQILELLKWLVDKVKSIGG